MQIALKKLHLHQQSFTNGEPFARRQSTVNRADKSAVDGCQQAVQVGQVDNVVCGDGGKIPEVFLAKSD